jgi:hypothetical protein
MGGMLKKEAHSPGQPGQEVKPYLKITRAKRSRSKAKVVEYLPSKYEALSSNSSTTKRQIN